MRTRREAIYERMSVVDWWWWGTVGLLTVAIFLALMFTGPSEAEEEGEGDSSLTSQRDGDSPLDVTDDELEEADDGAEPGDRPGPWPDGADNEFSADPVPSTTAPRSSEVRNDDALVAATESVTTPTTGATPSGSKTPAPRPPGTTTEPPRLQTPDPVAPSPSTTVRVPRSSTVPATPTTAAPVTTTPPVTTAAPATITPTPPTAPTTAEPQVPNTTTAGSATSTTAVPSPTVPAMTAPASGKGRKPTDWVPPGQSQDRAGSGNGSSRESPPERKARGQG